MRSHVFHFFLFLYISLQSNKKTFFRPVPYVWLNYKSNFKSTICLALFRRILIQNERLYWVIGFEYSCNAERKDNSDAMASSMGDDNEVSIIHRFITIQLKIFKLMTINSFFLFFSSFSSCEYTRFHIVHVISSFCVLLWWHTIKQTIFFLWLFSTRKRTIFTITFFIHLILFFSRYFLTVQIVYEYLPPELIIEIINRSIVAFPIILQLNRYFSIVFIDHFF